MEQMIIDGTYEISEQPVILLKDSDVGVLLLGANLYSNPLGDATFKEPTSHEVGSFFCAGVKGRCP